MNKTVILITGKAGAGKSTLANGLLQKWGGVRVAMADALKHFCDLVFKTDRENKNGLSPVLTDNFTKVVPSFVSNGKYLTNREVYQYFGSEVVRAICPDAWVNAVIKFIDSDFSPLFYIDDVRFPNEILRITESGKYKIIIVRLLRKSSDMDHISEKALDNFDFSNLGSHVTVLNVDNTKNTIEETLQQVEKMI